MSESGFAAIAILAAVYSCPVAVAEDASALYVKRASWQATALASRERYLGWRAEQGGTDPIELGQWYVTAPQKMRSLSDANPVEKRVDLEAKGPDGKPLWKNGAQYEDGIVHYLPREEWASTYLTRTITARSATEMKISWGSDDGGALWLNGERVVIHDVPRGVSANQDRTVLKLASGKNVLVFKIHNQTGNHGFYFATDQGGESVADSLWSRIERDFPTETGWMREDISRAGQVEWLRQSGGSAIEERMISRPLGELGSAAGALRDELNALKQNGVSTAKSDWLDLYIDCCKKRQIVRRARTEFKRADPAALTRAIEDLSETFSDRYPQGHEYLARAKEYAIAVGGAGDRLSSGDEDALASIGKYLDLRRDALLSNPLLDFEKLLVVKRGARQLGLPQNWQGNCAIATTGYDNEIVALSPVRTPGGRLTTVYRPEGDAFVGDLDLNFDGEKMLFSMPGSHGRWQVWEMNADGSGASQVTPGEHPDVDNYDPCYLPDGRIIFASTRCFHGVPCVGGGNTVSNLFMLNRESKEIRQLCFDQDHNWCPTVLNNGRLLYTRWEYTDTAHYFDRLLFSMNPDGTNQAEYYGSNSYWPNSIFYARPVPNHATKVVAIVSGHHGVPRMGELVIFDPALGRHEAKGVVQRIPGWGKPVAPLIGDQIVDNSWPRFLHPYPLSDKYFLVSCQPDAQSNWGIYLVDIFDNMLLLADEPGYALLEPLPLRKTRRPPVIPDKIRPDNKEATVYLADIYRGPGLAGVPRGTVKKLRVYEYHYAYPQMGGHINVGIDGPWDVHRIVGTVPVYADGSASFRVPANTPLAMQPLDDEGKAVQVMRSWFTAMPGEFLTCVGCHEKQNTTPPSIPTVAARRAPIEIEPWYGPTRGFSFTREVQPVLENSCTQCHSGESRADGKTIPNFADTSKGWQGFTKSYIALHPFVRRPGPESDYHLQKPYEWHADTSELMQMLAKGHYGVELCAESWDRLITWIDLNVPDHGTWSEHRSIAGNYHQRRIDMRTRYANRSEDPEAIVATRLGIAKARAGRPEAEGPPVAPACDGWPFSTSEAIRLQKDSPGAATRRIDLGDGVTLDLVKIPAGRFVMGAADGDADERPPGRVVIDKPFYIGVFEVTNEQYGRFDSSHDSGYISMTNKDQSTRGHRANEPRQPVVRVPWNEAFAFCSWLSEKSGFEVTLPTEAQWEWACRAGSASPHHFGDEGADFSKHANLADRSASRLALRDSPKWHPRDDRFDDGSMVSCDVGRYKPNAWGVYDMHGNVSEWTVSKYIPYPYTANDGRDSTDATGRRVVRGGSWYDRPWRARSAFRLKYHQHQSVYNVGFRVICYTR